jgi:hypothetical protein
LLDQRGCCHRLGIWLVEERGLQPLPLGITPANCGTRSRRSWWRSARTRPT